MLRCLQFRVFCAAVAIVAIAHVELIAQSPSEYQVKAAFLYNFVKFIEWPPPPAGKTAGPISLCMLGKDPFDGELARVVDGKNLDGRPFTIRRISDAGEAQTCQVLFVSASQAPRATEIAKRVAGWSVLTVGDADEFWQQGLMITFLMEGRKVRFRINQAAAERASLKISSKLLQLGVIATDKND